MAAEHKSRSDRRQNQKTAGDNLARVARLGGNHTVGIAGVGLLAVAVFVVAEKQFLDAHPKISLDAVNNMTQGLVLFDSAERVVVCNDRYIQMYGLSRNVVKPGCALRDLITHRKLLGTFTGSVEQYRKSLLKDLALGKATEMTITTPDARWIRIINKPMDGGGWLATHEDITEQRKLQQERDHNRNFLHTIVDSVPVAIMVREAKTKKYVLINRAGEEYLGAPRDSIMGKTPEEVWSKGADAIGEHDAQLLRSNGALLFAEHEVQSPGKGPRIVTTQRLLIHDAEGVPQYLLGVIEDVAERRKANDKIKHLAHYDALTDLPNRVLFRTQLDDAINANGQKGQLALLYLDFDQFKAVNDTFGHPIGDELLKTIAIRLRTCIPQKDIVARLGGDEFAIIQQEITDQNEVLELVDRIRETFKETCDAGGHRLVVQASIGVAVAADSATNPDELLKNADLAMYAAKADGRGLCRFFEPAMEMRQKERRALEADLREAGRRY